MLTHQAELYVEEGVDVIELGIPSRNPIMDGPLVASSMKRAYEHGMDARGVVETAIAVRERHSTIATVLMCYPDVPIPSLIRVSEGSMGAGFDGLLQVGITGYDNEMLEASGVYGINFVPQELCADSVGRAVNASGYIFLQATSGKTGLRTAFDMDNKARIDAIKRQGVKVPVLLGFGISNADHAARAVECGADGVVVGSACLAEMMKGESALRKFIRGLRSALDGHLT